jgi:CSLREA domain-containing protein
MSNSLEALSIVRSLLNLSIFVRLPMMKRDWTIKIMLISALITLVVYLGFSSVAVRTAQAATITVNTTEDELNNDGDCSLREAITAANMDTATDGCPAGSGTDTVYLPDGIISTALSGSGEEGNLTGDYDIFTSMTLKGAGVSNTVIDGNGLDRVFHITENASVQISDLTISDGDPGIGAGGDVLLYDGHLTLINSRVMNAAAHSGIYAANDSKLTILNSHIESNMGPGLDLPVGVTTTIQDSTIDANINELGNGGGISNGGTLTVTNSTISGNNSYIDGGGIANYGKAYLYNVTITNNRADSDQNNVGDGGGIAVMGSGVLTFQNTVLANNLDQSMLGGMRPDCAGTLTSVGYNLIQVSTDCTIIGDTSGNITNQDAMLGPLQNNGGPTFTHALLANSPAINAANPAGCSDQNGALLDTDQRGYARNGVCDIGAYEYNSAGTPAPTEPVPSPALFLPIIWNAFPATETGTSTPVVTGTATEQTPTPTETATPTQNDTQTPFPNPTTAVPPVKVNIVDYAYQPTELTIHVGEIVEWENTGQVNHTATSTTGAWDSGTLAPGQKYQFQFTAAGNYPYHCLFHVDMAGTIIVVP